MKDNLMQKMWGVFESIIKSEGATALTNERIKKCCEENGVDYEEFSASVIEKVLSVIGAHSENSGDVLPSELSSKNLEKVYGGSGFFQRGTASALAVLSLCGATQLPASAVKEKDRQVLLQKRVASRHLQKRSEADSVIESQTAQNIAKYLLTAGLGSFLTYLLMSQRNGEASTNASAPGQTTDLGHPLPERKANITVTTGETKWESNGFLPENNGLHEDSFEGKFNSKKETYSFKTDLSSTRGYHPFRVGVLNNTLDYCCKELGFKIKGKKIGSHLNESQYKEVLWELPDKHPKPIIFTEKIGSAEVKKSFDPKKCAKIWISNGRSLQTMVALKHMPGGSFDTEQTALLNLANYFTPGGGVLRGCVAQEESICRITTLYPLLRNESVCKDFYDINNNASSFRRGINYWRDIGVCKRCVYVPNVKQIKNDYGAGRIGGFIDGPTFNVITAAAPDLRPSSRGGFVDTASKEYCEFIKDLWRQIFAIAAYYRNINLIAGAIGCGAFRNDPKVVAEMFFYVLMNEGPAEGDHKGKRWAELFKNIVLPIYIYNSTSQDAVNYAYFLIEASKYKGLNIERFDLECPE